jgi:hypothetical protein
VWMVVARNRCVSPEIAVCLQKCVKFLGDVAKNVSTSWVARVRCVSPGMGFFHYFGDSNSGDFKL